ncbi:hypothetical protein QEH52_19665, partial [Coraliomargarita sp. SDUM461003]
MRAHLDREKSAAMFMGEFGQTLLIISYRFLAKDISGLVSDANMMFLIAEVDADYRSVLFSFHRRTRSQIAGATSNLLIPST